MCPPNADEAVRWTLFIALMLPVVAGTRNVQANAPISLCAVHCNQRESERERERR